MNMCRYNEQHVGNVDEQGFDDVLMRNAGGGRVLQWKPCCWFCF